MSPEGRRVRGCWPHRRARQSSSNVTRVAESPSHSVQGVRHRPPQGRRRQVRLMLADAGRGRRRHYRQGIDQRNGVTRPRPLVRCPVAGRRPTILRFKPEKHVRGCSAGLGLYLSLRHSGRAPVGAPRNDAPSRKLSRTPAVMHPRAAARAASIRGFLLAKVRFRPRTFAKKA